MTTVDFAAIALIALLALTGYLSGFLAQVVRILALVASFPIAVALSPELASHMNYSLPGGKMVRFDIVAFGIVWSLAYFLISFAGYAIVRRLKRKSPSLSQADKFTGMFLGAFKAVLLIAGVVGVLLWYAPQMRHSWKGLSNEVQNSKVAELLRNAPIVEDWLEPK